jgi:hypothetical protein
MLALIATAFFVLVFSRDNSKERSRSFLISLALCALHLAAQAEAYATQKLASGYFGHGMPSPYRKSLTRT